MNALSPELFQKYPPDVITKALLAHRDKLLRASREEVIAADREKCASLAGFIREGWHVIEPGTPYVHGFHIDVMSEHLQAVADGHIRRLMITVPPGMAKPVHVDELVFSRRGFVPLGEIVVGDEVLTHLGRFRRVTAVHDQGVIPTVMLQTYAGRSVRAAPDHPFLTPDGWRPLKELTPHTYVGFPHRIDALGPDRMTPEEARLLGYLVGDGCISQTSLSFVNMDQATLDDFEHCAAACGFFTRVVVHPNPNVKARKVVIKSTPTRWTSRKETPITAWLKRHGLHRSNSYTKRIPAAVLASSENIIGNFVGAYWSCDGCFSFRHMGKKTTMMGFATTVSRGLADDLLRALSLLNINCRVRTKDVNLVTKIQPGGKYRSFNIITTERNEVAKLALLPGLCPVKAEKGKIGLRDRFEPSIYADEVLSVTPAEDGHCKCLTVEEDQSFTANNLIVHNSTTVGVFFPMWMWGPKNRPSTRFVGVSHEQSLGVRDNLKCRRLVQSDWYQERWPLPITKDQNEKLNFENMSTGFRQVATPSNVTGRRGDYLLCDDLISVENANSVVEREKVNLWMQEALPTRMNDPEKSAIVLIMQRVHEDDPVGMILAKKWGWDHLNLPMRFESASRSRTSIGWEDPRTKDGELLFPERFPEPVVKELERTLGSFATASQLQQRPVPREGGLFKRAWFNMIKAAPVNARWVRYWDLAATAEQMSSEAAYTVGLKLGRTAEGRFVIADVARLRAEGQGVRRLIRETAREDGRNVEIGLPQDPGQAGKAQSQDMISMLAGYIVTATRESGDKLTRAEPVAAQAEAGNIDIVEADWTEAFMDELTTFPGSKFKDQVDALSGAFNKLIGDTVFDAREDYISVEPMPVMAIWPRVAAIFIDRKTVTTVWACHNPVTDVAFVYDTITVPRADMAIHANAIKKRGKWIPVMFNLKSKERDRDESVRLAQSLADLDVELLTVELDDEVAMNVIAERISVSSLLVFASQSDWFSAYRRLHRDDKDEIAGDDTGMMRTTGLIMASGLNVAVTENRAKSDAEGYNPAERDRSAVTGY